MGMRPGPIALPDLNSPASGLARAVGARGLIFGSKGRGKDHPALGSSWVIGAWRS